jgi:hypothetical protein
MYWWLKYIVYWMNETSHMLSAKPMFVVSYEIQGQWFILRKSVGPWGKVLSSILRGENPAHGVGFWDLEWKGQMGRRRLGHVDAREQIWQSQSSLSVTWKQLSDVLFNCFLRLNCYKTSVSEMVVNQMTFAVNDESCERFSHDIWKLNLPSKSSLWPA